MPTHVNRNHPDEPPLRLFFAVEIAAALRDAVLRNRKPFGCGYWSRAEQIHLTLRFLGDTPAATARELTDWFRRGDFPKPPIRLHITGATLLPQPRRASSFNLTIDPDPVLAAWKTQLDEALYARFGIVPEARSFFPHITVMRFRTPPAPPEREALLAWAVAQTFPDTDATAVTLFHSRSEGGRFVHVPLAQVFPESGGVAKP